MAGAHHILARVSEPLARLYDLALRTLDDQERRADALRGRLGPTLAAAALGVTLLSGPFVGGTRTHGVAGTLALLIAVGGFVVAVVTAALVLHTRHPLSSDIDIRVLSGRLVHDGALVDAWLFYSTMISQFARQAADNAMLVERLQAHFTAMLCGILVMLCGLALAALVG